MADQDFLGKVNSEVYFLRADIVFEFTTDREESWIVTSNDLILDKPLLERVGFLKRLGLLL